MSKEVKLSDLEVVTEPCRLAFPALFKPRPRQKGGDKLSYQAVILVPPDVSLKPFARAVKAAMLEKWQKVIELAPGKMPINRCETKPELGGYEAGWHYINTHSQFMPQLVDQRAQPVLDQDMFYPGCYCKFFIRAFAWDHPQGGKGVSFSLNALQFVRNDDRLDGRKDAADVFGTIEFDEDDMLGDLTGANDDLSDLLG